MPDLTTSKTPNSQAPQFSLSNYSPNSVFSNSTDHPNSQSLVSYYYTKTNSTTPCTFTNYPLKTINIQYYLI